MQSSRLFLISGIVQGVGFRYFVRQHATNLGLAGYAKNLADGNVEVLAIGEAKAIDTLRGHLQQGPRGSEVRHVEEREAAPARYDGFFVK